MSRAPAPTFDEHIEAVAVESPSALVLDWWRRLDQELRLVAGELNTDVDRRREFEVALGSDSRLSPDFAERVRRLRVVRNEVAHDQKALSTDDAKEFARESWALLCELARRPGRVIKSPWSSAT